MAGRAGRLRDFCNRTLWQRPRAWITIHQAQEQHLRRQGVQQPIAVVPNIFNPPVSDAATTASDHFAVNTSNRVRKHARNQSCNHSFNHATIGVCGRIEFRQKQQDLAVAALSQTTSVSAIFMGDGPDHAKLDQLIQRHHLTQRAQTLPWTDALEDIFNRIDCLVITSRYEGVPLVMLHALAAGVPVIAPNRDGMGSILPPECLFEHQSDLVALLQQLESGWTPPLPPMPKRQTAEQFHQQFVGALRIQFTQIRAAS